MCLGLHGQFFGRSVGRSVGRDLLFKFSQNKGKESGISIQGVDIRKVTQEE